MFHKFLLQVFKVKPKTEIDEKIQDIETQMQEMLMSKMIKFKPIGAPDLMSPEELISFQKKRIQALKKAKKDSRKEIRNDIELYYNQLCETCRWEFNKGSQVGVTCAKDFTPFSIMILLREVLRYGSR